MREDLLCHDNWAWGSHSLLYLEMLCMGQNCWRSMRIILSKRPINSHQQTHLQRICMHLLPKLVSFRLHRHHYIHCVCHVMKICSFSVVGIIETQLIRLNICIRNCISLHGYLKQCFHAQVTDPTSYWFKLIDVYMFTYTHVSDKVNFSTG